MAKIDKDGIHIISTQVKTALESLAGIVEKKSPQTLKDIQPQLEHIFTQLFDIENNWEKIDK
jgi:hypothetical protein